tara:strand:+ start:212 stop:862 length:651 start_codon:yes stop_codon:yes gene_type:complete
MLCCNECYFFFFANSSIVLLYLSSLSLFLLPSRLNLNPYEVLALPHDVATEEDIKQRYRALSGLVHPDKCILEGAGQAFEYVSGAHKELIDEQRRTIVINMINSAHKEAAQEIKKQFAKINQSSSSSNNSREIHRQKQLAVARKKIQVTRITFAQAEEARQRAEKNQQAYRKREDDQAKEEKAKLKKGFHQERDWNKGVDDRVSSWQSFAGIKKKK